MLGKRLFTVIHALVLSGMLVIAGTLTACGATSASSTPTSTTSGSTTIDPLLQTVITVDSDANLVGAGATFPAPLYIQWFSEYSRQFNVKINYQPVGSGTGIQGITNAVVDFGASDAIMTDAQVKMAENAHGPILHIPMTTGSVAIIYNLPGVGTGELKLTGDVLARIYMKDIMKWNDPEIQELNPDIKLPNTNIAVVHRSDGSGTTFIFTDYLCKVNDQWARNFGSATSINWMGDIGGAQSTGVAGIVQQIPNSIGYVEMTYAIQNALPMAAVKNSAGAYLVPSLAGTSAAADGIDLPDDMKVMITNSTGADAYPIAGFTWILVYKNQQNHSKGSNLVKMLWWALHEGAIYEADMGYASLSASALAKAEQLIRSIEYQGTALLTYNLSGR